MHDIYTLLLYHLLLIMFWIIWLGLITDTFASPIIVTPESIRTEISIRIGETKYIEKPPYFKFETVYRK